MNNGYVHLGDGIILLGGALLGWVAVPAAALGSLLADVLLGYVPYALPTFIIKGATAALAVWAGRSQKGWMRVIFWMLAEGWMVAGYMLTEWMLMGIGFMGALGSVPANLIQGASGVVIALALWPMLKLVRTLVEQKRIG